MDSRSGAIREMFSGEEIDMIGCALQMYRKALEESNSRRAGICSTCVKICSKRVMKYVRAVRVNNELQSLFTERNSTGPPPAEPEEEQEEDGPEEE